MADLRSAPVPGLLDDDHVRGPADAPLLIEYADLECPYCAAFDLQLAALAQRTPLRVAFRHFPVRSSHPRAWAAACASEAAGLQGRFREMRDALLGDQARLEDPHLWARAETLGLDVDRFDSDRRAASVAARVQRDFDAGVRGGVVTTPTVFYEGVAHAGDALDDLLERLRR